MTDINHIEVLREAMNFIADVHASGEQIGLIQEAIEAAITALSARASAGEGEPIGYVDPQRIHELKEGRLNIALFAERMGGNSLPLYAAAPQPAQAGASGGGDEFVLPAGWCTLGVGDGSGRLFVHGPYDAIKAAQTQILSKPPVLATPASPATRLDGATQCNACGGWNKPGCEPCCASPATGATLGVEGQMRLVAELANDMDEAHRAEQCTEFAKRLRAIFAPNWQTGAAHPQQAPAQEGKRWPFVESPGEFTARLEAAMREFPLIGAVRHVLIEKPPTLAAAPQPQETPVQVCKHKWRNSDRADPMLPCAWVQQCTKCGAYEDDN